jgi:MFS family permease
MGTGNRQPARNNRFFYGWLIVGILFFISIIDGGFTYIFSAFLKPLSQEFGWTRAETAGAFSLYLLAAGLVLPFWGWLADHSGVRVVFLLSAAFRCWCRSSGDRAWYGPFCARSWLHERSRTEDLTIAKASGRPLRKS